MHPAAQKCVRVDGLDDFISTWDQLDDALVLAGGQSLVPMLRLRLVAPSTLVNIGRIPGLKFVEETSQGLRIGSLTTIAELQTSEVLQKASPLLSDSCSSIADPLVRNTATFGGNLAHADPRNDLPAALVAARGEILIAGPNGECSVMADDFFMGPYSTSLRRGELVVGAVLPASTAGAYLKLKRCAGDYGIAAVAAQLSIDRDGRIESAGIALTGMRRVGERAAAAEKVLLGSRDDLEVVEAAAQAVSEECSPASDEIRHRHVSV